MTEPADRHRKAAEAWFLAKPKRADADSVIGRMRMQDYAQALADQEAEIAAWLKGPAFDLDDDHGGTVKDGTALEAAEALYSGAWCRTPVG